MKLELGMATVPNLGGWQVELLEGGALAETRYAAEMDGKVTVRRGRLVVVDRAEEPPRLLYRAAHQGEVLEIDGDDVSLVVRDEEGRPIADADGNEVQTVSADAFRAELSVGGGAFFTGGQDGRVVDVAVNGRPASPARVLSEVILRVRAIYGS